MSRGRNTSPRITACRECHARIVGVRGGRPRVVCSYDCALVRKARLAREALEADVGDSRAWWLYMTPEQRGVAMLWARRNPPPAWFKPRRAVQLWSYYNRHAFSCEGHVAAVAL